MPLLLLCFFFWHYQLFMVLVHCTSFSTTDHYLLRMCVTSQCLLLQPLEQNSPLIAVTEDELILVLEIKQSKCKEPNKPFVACYCQAHY